MVCIFRVRTLLLLEWFPHMGKLRRGLLTRGRYLLLVFFSNAYCVFAIVMVKSSTLTLCCFLRGATK